MKGGSRLAVSRAGKNRVELLEEISEILLERCGFEQDPRQAVPRWIVGSKLVGPPVRFLKTISMNQQVHRFAVGKDRRRPLRRQFAIMYCFAQITGVGGVGSTYCCCTAR